MTLTATTLTGGSVSMVKSAGDPGLFTYQSRSVKNPGQVSCSSNLGGTSGTQIATAKKRDLASKKSMGPIMYKREAGKPNVPKLY